VARSGTGQKSNACREKTVKPALDKAKMLSVEKISRLLNEDHSMKGLIAQRRCK
jgi:hypothetical protein